MVASKLASDWTVSTCSAKNWGHRYVIRDKWSPDTAGQLGCFLILSTVTVYWFISWMCAGRDDIFWESTFVVSLFLSESAACSLWLAGPSIVPCSRESRSNLMLWANRYNSQEYQRLVPLGPLCKERWMKPAKQTPHQQTCMQFVNMTHTAMSLEKIRRSSGLVSMQSFRQLSRKLVWWQSTSSMLDACWRREDRITWVKPASRGRDGDGRAPSLTVFRLFSMTCQVGSITSNIM